MVQREVLAVSTIGVAVDEADLQAMTRQATLHFHSSILVG
jgi:hypothetical protein